MKLNKKYIYAAKDNDFSSCSALLLQGAEIDTRCRFGYTALHYSALHGNVGLCEFLVNKGAQIDLISDNESGKTPLIFAAERGHATICLLLLNSGADGKRLVDLLNTNTAYFGGSNHQCTDILRVWHAGIEAREAVMEIAGTKSIRCK